MKRTGIRLGLILAMALLSPAHAQDLKAHIVKQLTRQGFDVVVQERTMLGRVRISAERDGGRREIVFNPITGEILRDLWQPGVGGIAPVDIIEDVDDLVDDDLVDDVEDIEDEDVDDDHVEVDDDNDDDADNDDGDNDNDNDNDNDDSGGDDGEG